MKLLLSILLFVFSFQAFAQTSPGNDSTKYLWSKYQYGSRMARFWADSVLSIPRDTTYSKTGISRIGTTLYIGNGLSWSAITGAATDAVDSLTISGASLYYWINGTPTGLALYVPVYGLANNFDSTKILLYLDGLPVDSIDNFYKRVAGGCVTIRDTTISGFATVYFDVDTSCIRSVAGLPFFDSTSLNYNNTKYIFYSGGVPVDSASIYASANIFNTNGTLTGNRILYGGNKYLDIVNVGRFTIFDTSNNAFNMGPLETLIYNTVKVRLSAPLIELENLRHIDTFYRVVTIDVNGNLAWRDVSTISGGVTDTALIRTIVHDSIAGFQIPPQNGFIVRPDVLWLNNYDYTITAGQYNIGGITYNSPVTDVTLAASDPTDPRIDVFAVNTSSAALVITGTPSTPPVSPSTSATEMEVSFANVAAGSSSPTITNNWIFRENAGSPTEWTASASAGTINPASTNNPDLGTIDVEGTAVANGTYITFTAPTTPSIGLYQYLVYRIRSKANWQTTKTWVLRFYSGTTAVGNPVTFGSGSYGFVSTNTSSYQTIVIPLSAFGNISNATVYRITQTNSTGTVGWYLDNVQLQASGGGGSNTGTVINVTASAPLSITGASTITPNVVADTTTRYTGLATIGRVVRDSSVLNQRMLDSVNNRTDTMRREGGSLNVQIRKNGIWTTQYTDSISTQSESGELVFFLEDEADPVISGYKVMDNPAQLLTESFVTQSTIADGQLIQTWITDAGLPGVTFIPDGVWQFHINAYKTGGSKEVRLYNEIYKRNLAGTETLLETTANSIALTGTEVALPAFNIYIPGQTVLSTDRIITKTMMRLIGGGSNPTSVTVGYSGSTAARLSIPAQISSEAKLNISDTAAMLSPYKNSYPTQAISLTTTGSSGAATYNNGTGVLNVPQYSGGGSGSSGARTYYNVSDFGFVGDGVTDNLTAMRNLKDTIELAGGGVIFFPAGNWYISDSVKFTKSVRIQGVINSGGLNNNISTALLDRFYRQFYATTILSGTNKSVFILDTASNGDKPTMAVEYLTFRGDTTGSATYGSFITVRGNLQNVSISNCTFFGGYKQVWLQAAFYPHITHCHFSAPTLYCILLDNDIRNDTGDGSITDCTFSSGTFATTTATAIYWVAGGGRRVTNCKFDASSFTKANQFIWDIDGSNTRSATSMWIIGANSFENTQVGSVRFNMVNSFVNFQMVDNQFAPASPTGSIVDITGATDVLVSEYTVSGAGGSLPVFKFTSCAKVSLGGGSYSGYSKLYSFTSCTDTSVIEGNEIVINRGMYTPIIGRKDSSSLRVFTNGRQVAMFDSTGLVGIGTNAPIFKLHVNADTSTSITNGLGVFAGNMVNGNRLIFGIGKSRTTNESFYWNYNHNSTATSRYLSLQGYENLPGTNSFTMLSGGNIGIGTLTPADKLSVVGNVGVSSGNITNTGGNITTSGGTISATGGGTITNAAGPISITGTGYFHANNTSSTGISPFYIGNDGGTKGYFATFGSAYVLPELRNNSVLTAANDFLFIGNYGVAGPTTTSSVKMRPGGYSTSGQIMKLRNDGVTIEAQADNTADASSILDVRSTTKGILVPRMTTAQRDAVSSPATGLRVYNTTTNAPEYYNGTLWLQEVDQVVRATSQTNATSTTSLANVIGGNLTAGKSYVFEAKLYTTSNVAGGVKVAMGGTATATSIIYEVLISDAGLTTQGRATAMGTSVGVTAVTAAFVQISGTITCNAAGTFVIQFAQNVSDANTSSCLVGSSIKITQVP